jgi:hypothetical protein
VGPARGGPGRARGDPHARRRGRSPGSTVGRGTGCRDVERLRSSSATGTSREGVVTLRRPGRPRACRRRVATVSCVRPRAGRPPRARRQRARA